MGTPDKVRLDLGRDADLVRGEREGKPRDQRVAQPGLRYAHARARCGQRALAPQHRDLEVEQLLVGKRGAAFSASARVRGKCTPLSASRGPGESLPAGGSAQPGSGGSSDGARSVIARGMSFRMRGLRQPLGERIDGEDPAETGGVLAPGLQLEVRALQLAAPRVEAAPDVEPASRARARGAGMAGRSRPGTPRRFRPRRGPSASATCPSPGRLIPTTVDDHRGLLRARRLRKGHHGGAVLVPARQEEEQVADGGDTQACQPLREGRADAVDRGDVLRQFAEEHARTRRVPPRLRWAASGSSWTSKPTSWLAEQPGDEQQPEGEEQVLRVSGPPARGGTAFITQATTGWMIMSTTFQRPEPEVERKARGMVRSTPDDEEEAGAGTGRRTTRRRGRRRGRTPA